MKKPIRVSIAFDIKLIKKCLALVGADIPSDEEISARFFEREMIITESLFEGEPEAELGICLALMSVVLEKEAS